MNRVERAVIMAAGKGTRLRPVTLECPKPLIKVCGYPMIETIIEGVRKNGIREIYVVTGYLSEQFSYLPDKYDGLSLIHNPYYDTCNNISSLYVARDHIENAIILDGDQIIYNTDILRPEFEKSGYCSVYTEEETDEWLQQVEGDVVLSCSRKGGKGGWQLFGVSFWNQEDGAKLKKLLEVEFQEKKNTDCYWDDIAMFLHPEEFSLGIRRMQQGDIIEVDNLEDLKKLDPSYEGI